MSIPTERENAAGRALLEKITISTNTRRRSEMAQEIISHKPGFIEKWALLIFLLLLLLMVTGTWFIQYPDVIKTRATVTAVNAPREIMSYQSGKLIKLFVYNNNKVSKGAVIGWIESTARHDEIADLATRIDSCISLLNNCLFNRLVPLFNKKYYNLGDIQQSYKSFLTTLQSFDDYRINGFYQNKAAVLESDIVSLEKEMEAIKSQQNLTRQDIKLAEETYAMHKTLFEQKVISKEEFRVQEGRLVSKQMSMPQLNASYLSREMQKRDKIRELEEVRHTIIQQELAFQQSLLLLKSALDEWTKKFCIVAAVDGRAFFTTSLQENQYVKQNNVLGYINPENNHFLAEVNLPQTNFGKIDTGFQVQLRLDAYPYEELGFVEGTLAYVSNVASDSGFLATIRLNNGLLTNNHHSIPYRAGLKAQALIITRNTRLLQRLAYSFTRSSSINR